MKSAHPGRPFRRRGGFCRESGSRAVRSEILFRGPVGRLRHDGARVRYLPWSPGDPLSNGKAGTVFWADERAVPPESPDSNQGTAHRLLLGRVPVPRGQIHAVNFCRRHGGSRPAYEELLARKFGIPSGRWPRFDLISWEWVKTATRASLFPGHGALNETSRRWFPYSTPRRNHRRGHLSLPVINSARQVAFVGHGGEQEEPSCPAVQAPLRVPGRFSRRNGWPRFRKDTVVHRQCRGGHSVTGVETR